MSEQFGNDNFLNKLRELRIVYEHYSEVSV